MHSMNKLFDAKTFKRFEKESFLDFMKRYELVQDISALHSRSLAVVKYAQLKRDQATFDLQKFKQGNFSMLKMSMGDIHAPTGAIREYYGDEIAIYFEWMNHFLDQIMVPAAIGLLFRVLNTLFYEDVSKSPLNAIFSIYMAFWGAFFSINWKRH
mmetsp:Transcript_16111/g.27226  ORF Transcript_16111/g.27226 Transcript_16111/m.27226 type:complete len:155 (+) Transcript_16111:611-1075(+)